MSEQTEEKKMVELVYFGKKYPKIIQTVAPDKVAIEKEKDRRNSVKGKGGVSFLPSTDKPATYKFIPFEALKVEEAVAKVLLDNAGDIFKRLDKPGQDDPTPEPQTKGHVGDTHAERIPDLDKTVEKENKADKGKSLEELMDSKAKTKEEEKEEETD